MNKESQNQKEEIKNDVRSTIIKKDSAKADEYYIREKSRVTEKPGRNISVLSWFSVARGALRSGTHGIPPSVLTAAVIALLLIVRSCVYGFKYFPQLDDYIQYWYYQKYSTFAGLQHDSGILGSRPLAGLADYFVWGRLPLIADVIILSIIFAVSAVFIRNALRRYFDLSALFPVIVTLMPLGIEASYWLSASTRIIMGIFAAALSELLFVKWLDGRGWRGILCLVFSALLMTASYGFYEQTGLLAAALVFVSACLEGRRSGLRPLGFLICVPASLAAFFIPALFTVKGSVYSSRVSDSLKNRTSLAYRLDRAADQLHSIFADGGSALVTKGFSRSAFIIGSERLAGWLILVIILCAALFMIAFAEKPAGPRRGIQHLKKPGSLVKKSDIAAERGAYVETGDPDARAEKERIRHNRGPAAAVISSLFLFAAPLAVFMLQNKPWISFRNAAASFIGTALIVDYVTCLLSARGGITLRRVLPAVIAAAAAFFFMFCSVSEMTAYKDVYNYDTEIAGAVSQAVEADTADGYAKNDKFAVLGVADEDTDSQTFFWHDHVLSCTGEAWAFSGLLRYTADDADLPFTAPLGTLEIYDKSNKNANDPRQFQHLFYYDSENKTAYRVKLELGEGVDIADSPQYWKLTDSAGSRAGTLVISKNSAKLLK